MAVQFHSRAVRKRDVVAASSYAVALQKSGESQVQRAVVQPNDNDRVKTEKWPAVSLYLDELLIQKCKFRHRAVASTLCLDKHSPKGSCHLILCEF